MPLDPDRDPCCPICERPGCDGRTCPYENDEVVSVEWGARFPDGYVVTCLTEADAVDLSVGAAEDTVVEVVARQCGKWRPIDRKTATLEVYESQAVERSQRWAWRLKAANGRIIADSGEGYTDRSECERMGRAVTCGGYDVEVQA